MLETLLLSLQNFYAVVERLQVTPGFLLGLALLFAIAGLLAMREAASWFFKVDDLKKDLARLQSTALQLESELRLVQTLLSQTHSPAPTEASASVDTKKPNDDRSASFPISH